MEVTVSTANNRRALLCLCLLAPGLALAGDWKITPGLILSETFSDNIGLDPSGTEKTDWVTEVRPTLSLRRQGARMKANVEYSLQGLLYAKGEGDNSVRHQLNGGATAELVEEWFFVDASARVGQAPLTFSRLSGAGGVAGINQSSTVGSFSISPYLKHRFGSMATMEARIEQSGTFIGDNAYSDATATRYALKLASGTHFFPLSWGFDYSRADQSNRNTALAQDTTTEHASANARYQFSPKISAVAQAGMDNNDLPGVTGRAARDFSYYGAGIRYTPGRRLSMEGLYNVSDSGNFLSGNVTFSPTVRTTLNASLGERAYGRSYSLGLTHRSRHSNWSLRYEDDLTSWQQIVQEQSGLYYCPTDGTIGAILPGVPIPSGCFPVIDLVPRDETFVSKHLTGSVDYTLRRNTWRLSLFSNRREYQTSGDSDTLTGLQAAWVHKAAAHTTYTLTAGLSHNQATGLGARDDDSWNVSAVASHQLKSNLTGSLELRHQERQSNQATGDYMENSVAARVNMTF